MHLEHPGLAVHMPAVMLYSHVSAVPVILILTPLDRNVPLNIKDIFINEAAPLNKDTSQISIGMNFYAYV